MDKQDSDNPEEDFESSDKEMSSSSDDQIEEKGKEKNKTF
jgi:hypothetical protein|tara:strand:- start:952 stop:1071 length:120 start_codon:yes stop_codon:yes gene_type:complete